MDCRLITQCGLLHDIGKVIQRAGGSRETHAVLGTKFLRQFLPDPKEERSKALLHAVRYHHYTDLFARNLPADDYAWLVYEADNIAAGTDRRSLHEGDPHFNPHVVLENIFNTFNPDDKKKTKSYYRIHRLDVEQDSQSGYPRADIAPDSATPAEYASIEQDLKKNFRLTSPVDMSVEEMLRILEDTLRYVPSSTNTGELVDISLYDHSRITGAAAAVLLQYCADHGITDYHEFVSSKGTKNYRQKPVFLLVSGDFSGIQKFIYRVPSSDAMRMLRGRSFYLEIALENMVDELLKGLGLSRANCIYCGGGHFYLLASNTSETVAALKRGFARINRQLAELFQTGLFLASGWTEVSADELMGKSVPAQNMFQRVNRRVSLSKQQRYGVDVLTLLFDAKSGLNHPTEESRECAICHRIVPVNSLKNWSDSDGDTETAQACPLCRNFRDLGKVLLEQDYIFTVLSAEGKDLPHVLPLPLPSPWEDRYLAAVPPDRNNAGNAKVLTAEELSRKGCLVHLYARNKAQTSSMIRSRLWVADYAAKDETTGTVKKFRQLADASGEVESGHGIRRLGVLRADVDWLGAAFIAGFNHNKVSDHTREYATLSRCAALSGSLAFFFKYLINRIAEKKLPPGQEPFYLFRKKDGQPRDIHIVYSGGDDLFLVGAWDDLLEMAVDLRRAFRQYTNDQLSFSAGLGLFSDSYPILRMAEATGNLEDLGKSLPMKDGLALWGVSEDVQADQSGTDSVFTWDVFLKHLVQEKLAFLCSHFALEGIPDGDTDPLKKIPAGRTLLYRLLLLLRSSKRFNLARYAYVIARMEPKGNHVSVDQKTCYREVRDTLYRWGSKDEDRKYLIEALQLLIYRMRER